MRSLALIVTLVVMNSRDWGLYADELGSPIISQDFRLPPSTLETATRRLESETNVFKRFHLLLRWIKIKEEVDKTLISTSEDPSAEKFKTSKKEIITRIHQELPSFQKTDLPIVNLYRELGYRQQEIGNFNDSIAAFEKIANRTADDHLSYGDALLAVDRTVEALDAYELASREPRLRAAATYKRAWGLMRLARFAESLKDFDRSIREKENSNARLRAEAYKDRIRPFLESFQKSEFDQETAQNFKSLALIVHPEDPAQQKQLYIDTLKSLVEGFNDRAEIEKAQNAFSFLTQEIKDATEVLLFSAPTWIKVYRSRLDHASVSRILQALPNKELDPQGTVFLRTELYNTAVFYENIKEANNKLSAKPLLITTYAKYFTLYPKDLEADALRINYSQILLEKGEATGCLDILDDRGGKEPEVEVLASSLEAKCTLRQLDQLYASAHDLRFQKKLENALITNKIYQRPDLGVTPLQAFEALARMLIGTLSKNPNILQLRSALESLIKEFPFPEQKDNPLFSDLQTASAELRFKEILESRKSNDEKSEAFFAIFNDAKSDTDVALKALTNGITLGRSEPVLDRCDRFKMEYPKSFAPGELVFERCIQLAEHFLNIEREYSYWIFNERKLLEPQKLRLGLLELALGQEAQGRTRIQNMNTASAREALALWNGESAPPEKAGPAWNALEKKIEGFLSTLKPIRFEQIQTQLPKTITAFEKWDSELLDFAKKQSVPLAISFVFEFRAKLSSGLADWIKALPEPPGLDPNSLQEYHLQAQEVVGHWTKRAEARRQECSENAFLQTRSYTLRDPQNCPEATPDGKFKETLNEWRKKIPTDRRASTIVRTILKRAENLDQPLRSRYYLFRALELSNNHYERALVHVALAKLTKSPRFWSLAYSLDPGQPEAIEHFLNSARGNPFFERLYQWQLRELRLEALNP